MNAVISRWTGWMQERGKRMLSPVLPFFDVRIIKNVRYIFVGDLRIFGMYDIMHTYYTEVLCSLT